MKKYSINDADPPWRYNGQSNMHKKSLLTKNYSFHYNTMTDKELMELPIINICNDDALLFLWVTNPFLLFGIKLMNSWGFSYKTVGFVWHKHKPTMGFYTMSSCELCLIGKRGNIPSPRGARNVQQFISEKATKHSQKPDEIRNRIMTMFPTQNKIELFARNKYDGWDVWGNEIESTITL